MVQTSTPKCVWSKKHHYGSIHNSECRWKVHNARAHHEGRIITTLVRSNETAALRVWLEWGIPHKTGYNEEVTLLLLLQAWRLRLIQMLSWCSNLGGKLGTEWFLQDEESLSYGVRPPHRVSDHHRCQGALWRRSRLVGLYGSNDDWCVQLR